MYFFPCFCPRLLKAALLLSVELYPKVLMFSVSCWKQFILTYILSFYKTMCILFSFLLKFIKISLMKLGTNSKYISPGFKVLFHLQKSVLEKIFSLCGLFDFFQQFRSTQRSPILLPILTTLFFKIRTERKEMLECVCLYSNLCGDQSPQV